MTIALASRDEFEAVLARLKKVSKRTSTTAKALCPSHDDHNPSLDVSIGHTGKVLLYCHTGCSYEAIRAALDLPVPVARPRADVLPLQRKAGVVAEYDYVNIDGAPHYQIQRTDDKQFPVRRPDGRGGWIKGLGDLERVLYHDPAVREAAAMGRQIFVVEGEKDTDRLRALGLTATTSPFGAGQWNKGNYAPSFAGASQVIVVPDHDAKGEAHALDAARSIATVVDDVRILGLPDQEERQDVSDWLSRGNTLDQLLALADTAPRFDPTTAPVEPVAVDGTNGMNEEPAPKRLALVRAADVRMEPVTWIWRGYIPRGKLTIADGKMGVGKTTTVLTVLGAVTHGGPLPGQPETPQGAAIIISLEDGLADTIVPRLKAAGADLARCHIFNGYEFGGEPVGGAFNIAQDVERLREAILTTGALIVMVDPLSATWGGKVNTNQDSDVRHVLAPLAKMAEETNVAIVVVRHVRKGGGSAEDAGGGSGGIGNACRSVLRVDNDPENPDRFLLSVVKASVARKATTLGYRIEGVTFPGATPIETSRIVWDGESEWTAQALASLAMTTDERPRAEEAKDWLQDALDEGPRLAKDLFRNAEADGIPRRTLQRAADVLQVIKERKGFGEGSLWSLPAAIRAIDAPFTPFKTTAPMGTTGTNGYDSDELAILRGGNHASV